MLPIRSHNQTLFGYEQTKQLIQESEIIMSIKHMPSVQSETGQRAYTDEGL